MWADKGFVRPIYLFLSNQIYDYRNAVWLTNFVYNAAEKIKNLHRS